MRGRKMAALVLCVLLLAAMAPVGIGAKAAVNDLIINYTSAGSTFTISNKQAVIQFSVTNTTSDSPATISSIVVTSDTAGGTCTALNSAPGAGTIIKPLGTVQFTVITTAVGFASGTFPVHVTVKGADDTEASQVFLLSNDSAEPTPTPLPTPSDATTALMPISVGANGQPVAAPRGNAGEKITVRIPLMNRSAGTLINAFITPVLSATRDNFPFVIEAVDYTVSIPQLYGGEVRELQYQFTLAKDVTSGVKEVKFNAVYFNVLRNAYETTTFSVFVTVVKGAAPTQTDDKGQVIASVPKIILAGYSYKPEKEEDQQEGHLYAGEKFDLTLTIENTSAEEAVRNIQLTLSNEAGVILPADSGSNTIYIDKIAPGESVQKTLKFQSAPDAEAKAQSLALKFNYESAKTLKTYEATEAISLPILQRMRVRIDDPVVNGDALLGSSMPVSFSLYNMGKSTIYNCMVDVEGDGLKLEEPFYGGNVTAGNTMQADLSIIPSVAGEVDGTVVITYEDVYGQQTRVEKPLTLNVQDSSAMPNPGGEGGDKPGGKPGMGEGGEAFNPGGAQAGLPLWAYIVIGVVAVAGIGSLIVVLRRKRRKKHLEEQ